MQLKRCDELNPGMIVAKDIHTRAGLLLLNEGDTLNAENIDKLIKNSISFVFIKDEKDLRKEAPKKEEAFEKKPAEPFYMNEKESYYDRIQESQDYKQFRGKFSAGVVKLRGTLNRIVKGNPDADLTASAKKIVSEMTMPKGSIPVFDLMSNMRRFDDVVYVHSLNVAMLAGLLARWLGFSDDDVALAQECGLFHDIGKLTIPHEIISKPGKLTREEFEIIKNHPRAGYEILKNLNMNEHVLNAALQHHQKCDGTGYPEGFNPKNLDPFAKLITLVDIYDAITSTRSYRDMVCPFKVLRMFEDEGITKYDPKYYSVFLQHIAKNFVGNKVLLSDGRTAKVVMTNKVYYSRPLVVSGSEFIDLAKRKDLYIDEVV